MATARSDIVSLLVDLDWGRRGLQDIDWTKPLEGTNACFHDNGEIFTTAEMKLVGQTGTAELEAMLRYGAAVVQHAEEEAADALRIGEMARPHFDRGVQTLGEVRELLTPTEAVEFDEIMSRCAPDGHLIIGPA